MIAGNWFTVTNNSTVVHLFFQTLDKNLTPLNFKKVSANSYSTTPVHMIHDEHDKYVVTYTHGNTSIPYNNDPNYPYSVASGVGFLRINDNLQITDNSFTWHDYGLENYGLNIHKNHDGDYLVFGMAYEHNNSSGMLPPLTSSKNPMLLKFDANGQPQYFKRYNIFRHSLPIASYYDDVTDNLLVCSATETYPFRDWLQVISTNSDGIACGENDYTSNYLPYTHTEANYSCEFFLTDMNPANVSLQISDKIPP